MNRWAIILFVITLTALPLIIGYQLLENCFAYGGEALHKGEGHILQEDLQLGMIVIVLIRFGWMLFPCTVLFFCLENIVRKYAFWMIFCLMALPAVLFIVVYTQKMIDSNYTFVELMRPVEIVVSWIVRLLGILSAFFIVNKVKSLVKSNLA